jgi:hypothetical protein
MATAYKLKEGLSQGYLPGKGIVRQSDVLRGDKWKEFVPAILQTIEVEDAAHPIQTIPKPSKESVVSKKETVQLEDDFEAALAQIQESPKKKSPRKKKKVRDEVSKV